MHINIIKGDLFFKQWEDEDLIKMESKLKELKTNGYKLITPLEYDFQNVYYHLVNKDGEEVVLTLLCC